jgi:hypothetical protein
MGSLRASDAAGSLHCLSRHFSGRQALPVALIGPAVPARACYAAPESAAYIGDKDHGLTVSGIARSIPTCCVQIEPSTRNAHSLCPFSGS